MAGRFGSHLGHHTQIKHEQDQFTPQLASSSPSSHSAVQQHILANSLGQGTILNTITHTPGHSQTHFDHRGSISTERTSFSDLSKRGDSLDILPEEPMQPRLVKKTRGSYKLADFVIQRTLGTGSFGRVHLVQSKHNLRFYAIKVLNKEKVVKMKQEAHTNNEQHILECIQHPFIVNLWGTFQDCTNLYMVMDFVPGGELFTLLRRSNRFPDPVAKFYAAEVAMALDYLHSLDIIYRDLKPENILLNIDGHIKVADFGFAKSCDTTTWTLCGTPDYLAPEIIQQQRYNKSVDWYALGILIFEMLSGLPPYHQPDANPVLLYEKITRGPAFIRWPTFQPLATDLILKLMESDPSKRYGNMRSGAGDVFSHGWFKEVDWVRLGGREITAPYLPKVRSDGDASAFELYAEDDSAKLYGVPASDPYGPLFTGFEYSAPPVSQMPHIHLMAEREATARQVNQNEEMEKELAKAAQSALYPSSTTNGTH
ncbi:camp-dependent protein kinase catalytic subunit [Pleurotus pulmonarius]|nr:camp-dependent protein kinase catalytic subunit [Pleurotus pulmonarius]